MSDSDSDIEVDHLDDDDLKRYARLLVEEDDDLDSNEPVKRTRKYRTLTDEEKERRRENCRRAREIKKNKKNKENYDKPPAKKSAYNNKDKPKAPFRPISLLDTPPAKQPRLPLYFHD